MRPIRNVLAIALAGLILCPCPIPAEPSARTVIVDSGIDFPMPAPGPRAEARGAR